MNVGKKALRFGNRLIHFLTLGFTAFWLVATSKPNQPAQDCFVALREPRLKITLGAEAPAGRAPSCAGLDGLAAGAALEVTVTRSPAPPMNVRSCWSYQVGELRGPSGVSDPHPWTSSAGLFELDASFRSSAAPEQCSGDYHLLLAPVTPVPDKAKANPLRAGRGESWKVTRSIRVAHGQACNLLPTLPSGYCEDSFEVRSVVGAP